VLHHQFSSFEPHAERLEAGCTGREGGVSGPPYDELNVGLHVGDDPRAVLENRRRVARALGVELASFVIPQQVHRGGVQVVTSADRGRGALRDKDVLPGADALITRARGIVLAVMLADCVPMIVFDPLTPAVGIAHAGWAGTVQHVVRNTVEAMRREFGSKPSTLLAGVGPSIGPDSYEVGTDVAERAQAEFPGAGVARPLGEVVRPLREVVRPLGERNGKFLLDLWGCNVADLLHAGLARERIEVAGLDTFQMPERFFSYRRQPATGRFFALAMLRA
jgi:YfiH family protein